MRHSDVYSISNQLNYQDVILFGCQNVSKKTSLYIVKTSIYHVRCPQMVGYMWTSCRMLLCVIQNNPSPLTPSNTHRCCQSIWRTRWTSQFIRSSHMPLCVIVCYMFIPKQWMDWFVFVCLLVSCFVFVWFLFLVCSSFWLFRCVNVTGVENWCRKPKKLHNCHLRLMVQWETKCVQNV